MMFDDAKIVKEKVVVGRGFLENLETPASTGGICP